MTVEPSTLTGVNRFFGEAPEWAFWVMSGLLAFCDDPASAEALIARYA